MKIVILDAANLTPFYNHALAGALANEGHSVEYISTEFVNDPALKAPDNIAFNDFYFRFFRSIQKKYNSTRKWIRLFFYAPDHIRLFLYLRRVRPDILHIQWSRIAAIDFFLIKAIRLLKIPVVHTIHDVDPLFKIGSKAAIGRLYDSAQKLIVHSRSLKEELISIYPNIETKKIAVIPHGPLQGETTENKITSQSAKKSLAISENDFVVLFFGEIKHYKGLDILLAAACMAANKIENLHILIAGKPESGYPPPDTTELLNCNVKVTACYKFIPNNEVQLYFSAADVVALPYRKISQSGVIFSAISQSKPVICADTGGLREVIEDTDGGWLYPPNDIEKLAEALIYCASQADSLVEKGIKANQLMIEKYSWDNIAKKTTDAYSDSTRGYL